MRELKSLDGKLICQMGTYHGLNARVKITNENIVRKVMTNFLYTFRGKDRKQKDGVPIGDVLTQAMSRHMGNEFDNLFNDQVIKLGIKQELLMI